RRSEAHLDLAGDAGALPIVAADRDPLVVQVAAEETAVVAEAARDAERAVAGEGADLDRRAGADRAHEKRHQGALVRPHLHAADAAERGRLPRQVGQHRVLLAAVVDDVGVELRVERRELVGHSALLPGAGWPSGSASSSRGARSPGCPDDAVSIGFPPLLD